MDRISDEKPPRTFAIWWFLALFVGLVGFGIYAVIAWGTYAREPTRELPEAPATTDPDATTTSSSVPLTLVDGTPAQPGIASISGTRGDRVYLFELPEGFDEVATASEVPPVELQRAEDDRTLTLEIGCAVSAEAVPSMVRHRGSLRGERHPGGDRAALGDGCADGASVGSATIVLDDPVGARRS
ncbi:MAG: hypothetical protein R2716_09440 [Microthrixaceae bacterium]